MQKKRRKPRLIRFREIFGFCLLYCLKQYLEGERKKRAHTQQAAGGGEKKRDKTAGFDQLSQDPALRYAPCQFRGGSRI